MTYIESSILDENLQLSAAELFSRTDQTTTKFSNVTYCNRIVLMKVNFNKNASETN